MCCRKKKTSSFFRKLYLCLVLVLFRAKHTYFLPISSGNQIHLGCFYYYFNIRTDNCAKFIESFHKIVHVLLSVLSVNTAPKDFELGNTVELQILVFVIPGFIPGSVSSFFFFF
ncbi:hypothetical protein EGW08_007539 [Elysia chlorotica]|uniref:Uncharacterized protein n=1 Tax=Elysia chlorotica TaxID=188477 RepID=A0A3S0ZR03_ELYCH|nr:hypothetical protein EGW08_007539 [Elysia chlorotica]